MVSPAYDGEFSCEVYTSTKKRCDCVISKQMKSSTQKKANPVPYGIFLVDITNRIGSDERRIAVKGALHYCLLFLCGHVVTEMPGAKVPADTEGDLTLRNGKVAASDIVADSTTDTTTIANLTFHELMHNKLGMGDEIHKLGGLARSPLILPCDQVRTNPGHEQASQ